MTTFGHPPPEPDSLRDVLTERLRYLNELLRGGLDDHLDPSHGVEYRAARFEQVREYIAQVEQLLLPQEGGRPWGSVDRVLMDIPVSVVDEETGEVEVFRVVGPGEADFGAGLISFLSPLGSALLLKRVGEQVVLEAPGGQFIYRVASIGGEEARAQAN